MRITDLRIEIIEYWALGARCVGSNLMYLVRGTPRSSRVPWAVTDLPAEKARLEKLIKKQGWSGK